MSLSLFSSERHPRAITDTNTTTAHASSRRAELERKSRVACKLKFFPPSKATTFPSSVLKSSNFHFSIGRDLAPRYTRATLHTMSRTLHAIPIHLCKRGSFAQRLTHLRPFTTPDISFSVV
eukprot:760067_1